VPAASITTSASPTAGFAAEQRGQLPALGAAAHDERPPARVRHAGGQHQPDRAGAENRHRVALLDVCAVDAVQAAGERFDERGDLGGQRGRDGQEVAPCDPLGDDDQLRIGAVEQRKQVLAQCLLTAAARRAGAAGCGVRRHHPATRRDVDSAELVPERARRRSEQERMAAS
jgi:hypothetical protein